MTRDAIKKIVTDKLERVKNNPEELEMGDLISIMMNDPMFRNDTEMMVDEALTFFMAGT